MNKITLLCVSVLALAGCATVQLPNERMQANIASIRAAEELGADGVPSARLHLQLAKDQTESARRMAEDGNERALIVLARAQSDAELALSLAKEASVHRAAVKASEELKAVRARTAP
jgi:hypothetical protein